MRHHSVKKSIQKPIKSYVKRQGRLTESQSRALQQLSARYVLPVDTCLSKPARPLIVEIGFGNGEALVAMAAAMPYCDFIGIEVHTPGVGHCIKLLEEKQLDNVRLYRHDAVEVLQNCLPEQCVQQVNVFFPDPWHKKKHHKRRLFRPEFFDLLRGILIANAVVHFATDWQPYAEWVRELLVMMPDFHESQEAALIQHHRTLRAKTKFEKRGERLGHAVTDMVIEYRCS